MNVSDMKPGIFYMAHPYTGNKLANFLLANSCMAELIKRGYIVHSPITHTYPPSRIMDFHEWGFWMDYDRVVLENTKWAGLILCPNWEDSRGCCVEKLWFEERNIKVLYYEDLVKESYVQ